MANTITLAKNYISMLDEVYRAASTADDLTSSGTIVREGANANEILVPKISMSGLRNYDRATGYKTGNVKLEWETKKFEYDRGIIFNVDVMDDEETINTAFAKLGAELVRTMVVPEADAYTYAKICAVEGIGNANGSGETYENGEQVLDALVKGVTTLDEAGVPSSERYLKITPTLLRMAQNVKSYINMGIFDSFAKVTPVPQTSFYTKIDLLDEEAGYFKKNSAGADLNFMIVHKPAIIKYDKHVTSNIISPDANQSADAYMLKYRKYGIVEAFDNKAAGIYISHKAVG